MIQQFIEHVVALDTVAALREMLYISCRASS